jgi:hypothetical protein
MKKSLLTRLAKNGNPSFSLLLLALVALGFLLIGCSNPAGSSDPGSSTDPGPSTDSGPSAEFPAAWIGKYKSNSGNYIEFYSDDRNLMEYSQPNINYKKYVLLESITLSDDSANGTNIYYITLRINDNSVIKTEKYQFDHNTSNNIISVYDENGGNSIKQVILYADYIKQ